MRRLALIGALVFQGLSAGFCGEVEFVEDFALAKDRAAALKQLIPGTEDYFYYHGLYYLQSEQFEKIEPLLANWVQRLGETQRVWEIRTRYALTAYDKNPQKSLVYLRERLGLTFSHQKEELNAEPNFPTTLDQADISRQAFTRRANSSTTDNVELFEDSALDWLLNMDLNGNQRRSLLSRLMRPDHEKLLKLVVDDLNAPRSGGFGSLGIHSQLLISQLEELLKSKPELLNNQNFVKAYVKKLQPTADEDWRHDFKQLEAYLDRLYRFASRLAPSHNSLKSHVLYHRLVLDRRRDELNKERFVEYLKLPRKNVHYLSKRMLESDNYAKFASDLNADYSGLTLLPPIVDDEPLVRSDLASFLVDAPNTKEFEPYISDTYLQQLFAEVKILNGLGDAEQWAALLPPARFQQLKERVDLDFASKNKSQFEADEPVKLDLFVKNVGTMIVKIFEINTQNYYRDQLREVDTDIGLDGLVANYEKTYSFSDPPLRRTSRRFEFPQLDKPGVYIVDFIGNGKGSRALIRKGRMRHLVRTSPVGQVFTIFNDRNEQLKDATIWLAGHEYTAEQDGSIVVPFSAKSGRQPIVITQGGLSSLDYFQQESEEFKLTAGFYVDRESLLTRKNAQLLVRPSLTINGTQISLRRLQDAKLTITSTDLDDITTVKEVDHFPLFEDRESTHEFQVPDRLASLQFVLTAKAKKLSAGGELVDLASNASVTLNGSDKTEKIEQPFLAKFGDSYVIELRGKTGEPRPSRPVTLTFKHRNFRQTHDVTLKTDAAGRILLGALNDITVVSVRTPEDVRQTWNLKPDRHTYASAIDGKAGESISIPYFGHEAHTPEIDRADVSLLEVRDDSFLADRFSHLSFKDGFLVLNKLPAGDFDLLIKASNTRIRIRVSDGPKLGEFVMGRFRQLETPKLAPLQIEAIKPVDGGVSLKLQNASKFSRVHVFATRYVPEYDSFAAMSEVRAPEPYQFQQAPAESVYLTGRNIGDEYRYIFDRKYVTKYPGNMLDRPSLLLNPWSVRTTETGEQQAVAGDEFRAAGVKPSSEARRGDGAAPGAPAQAPISQNLNFLAQASVVLLNLVPDERGEIHLKNEVLGDHQQLHVVAVDPLCTTARSLSLPEKKGTFLDLRLASGLNPKQHFTQQKLTSIAPAGQPFSMNDVSTAKFEIYDSLSSYYHLLVTLNHDQKLLEFSFIKNWPKLKAEEKRSLYSKYASHELSFFLFKKDPEFFQAVIKPHLANKKDKEFLDRYLLNEDLSNYLLPSNYERLNVVEQILLAGRIEGERPNTSRYVTELFELQPPNLIRFCKLFDTSVKRSSLDFSDETVQGLAELQLRNTNSNGVVRLRMEDGSEVKGFAGAGGVQLWSEANSPKDAAKKLDEKQVDAAQRSLRRKSGVERSDKLGAALNGNKEQLGEGLGRDQAFYDDRGGVRQLYRKVEKTREWAENNYHHLTIDQQNGELITVNSFWKDFALHDPATPFLSRNLAEPSHSFAEMMLALAVVDLPFESPKHETKLEGQKLTLTPGGATVVFHEEIKPTAAADGASKVLVSQNFFRFGDRTRLENGEQIDQFIEDEYLINVVYGCQVVVTNPTSARQRLNLLTQIPIGSLPVRNSQATNTTHFDLEPYHTETFDFYFYFPLPGQFSCFPVHVAKNETLVASANPILLNVVERPTKIDADSWDYVSQQASNEDLLTYLDKHNIAATNLERIAWRMQDVKVFTAVVTKLAQRHVYHHTLWSYAIKHNVPAMAREFLSHANPIISDCGGRLSCTLLTVNPVKLRTAEYLEYSPLVNARAHALGHRRQIVNDRFHAQYHQTLKQLSYERTLDDNDLLTVTYYLLLQDRIEEALQTFARVNIDKIAAKMQFDYCAAYLSLFTENYQQASTIAAKYANYPVDRWQQSFAAITAQLDEAQGKAVKPANEEDRNQQMSQLASTEPSFDFNVESGKVVLDYRNLRKVQVNFYEVDIELLFSRNPFVQQFRHQFSSIKPNQSIEVDLSGEQAAGAEQAKSSSTRVMPLPAAFQAKNVVVEVVGAGQSRMKPYYSHSLSVQMIDNYGQLKVTHQVTGKPVSKAYVKVFVQTTDGKVKFYKDGYTDVRGRFDYASLSTNELDSAAKFSILILSDEHGAMVREATPPKS